MIIEFFKYDLYRKYQTSDGATYTPLDDYKCVLTDNTPNDDCEITSSYATYGEFPIIGDATNENHSLYYYISQAKIDYAYNFDDKIITYERLVKKPANGFQKFGLHLDSKSTSLNMTFRQTYLYSFESNWDTSKITSLSNMFYQCDRLINANLSSFDTKNVTSCNAMFYNCSSLTEIDLSNFDLSNVIEEDLMKDMFSGCTSLIHIKCNQKFYDWCITNQVVIKLPSNMVEGSIGEVGSGSAWEIIDYVAPVTNYTIFGTNITRNENEEALLTSKKEYFNAIKINDIEYILNGSGDYSYTFPTSGSNNIEYSTISDLTSIKGMFNGCSSLSSIDLTNFSTSAMTDMSNLFMNCTELTSVKLNNFDTSNATTINSIFYNCQKLTSLNFSNLNLSNVTDMSYAFGNCSGLTNIDLTNTNISFDASVKTSISHLFENCSNLTSINLSNWKITKNTNISYLFANCTKLESIDISSFDTTENVYNSNIEKMFYNCNALKSIRCTGQFYFWCFDVQRIINMTPEMGKGTVGRVGSGSFWEIVDYDDYFGN